MGFALQVVWCSALEELQSGDEYQITGTVGAASAAYGMAGFIMLVGMFVCCCCKAPPARLLTQPETLQQVCVCVCVCVCLCV